MARVLINVPANARPGEVIEIKALIAHPMETGYRTNSAGMTKPRDIITDFECRFEGEVIFKVKFAAAIAANPFISFFYRVAATGILEFRWSGDHDFQAIEQRRISLI